MACCLEVESTPSASSGQQLAISDKVLVTMASKRYRLIETQWRMRDMIAQLCLSCLLADDSLPRAVKCTGADMLARRVLSYANGLVCLKLLRHPHAQKK